MWQAHGKLLLTGEYFVLDGAKALAAPCQYGQTLRMTPIVEQQLQWQSLDHEGNVWFKASWHTDTSPWTLLAASDDQVAHRLVQLWAAIANQDQAALVPLTGQQISVHLAFPRQWGLGSSSTLISLLAQLTKTDPYQLLAASFGGSGYDIACATAKGPIYYQRQDEQAVVHEAVWAPDFHEQLFFAYLGKKQDSRAGIRHYRELCGVQATLLDEVSNLTDAFVAAQSLEDLMQVVVAHEDLISTTLQLDKVKDIRFVDFPGAVKSLGAWGGDFVLVCSPWPAERTKNYLHEKGCSDILAFREIML